MHALIVGAGVAGLTAALQLRRAGWNVTIMERQPAIPSGGYMVDFFGPGYDVAERLGLLPELEKIHYPIGHLQFVDGRSHVDADLPYPKIRHLVFRDRHLNFMRGDLVRVLSQQIGGDVDLRFGTWPIALYPVGVYADGEPLTVEASRGPSVSCDLLIGADGAHSAVRDLAFLGGETSIVRLGCHTAAYVIDKPIPGLAEDAFVSMSARDISAAAYPIREGRTATLFLHRAPAAPRARSPEECRQELESVYRGEGWILDRLLDAFPDDGDVFFDDVVQIELLRWSDGPVVLLGDAAWCVSLLAGQGASLAMYGGYVLAQELSRSGGDVRDALVRYEARLRPLVARRQRAGRRARSWFLPKTRWGRRMRDRFTDFVVKTPAAGVVGRFMGGARAPLD
jgi:2-polyprenyl-6-methoxyphenol hydroxylase-like FAD-dependent oxidoreductase